MAFRIFAFLPTAGKRYLDGPGDGRVAPYELGWAKRYTPGQGATNYSRSTQQLPRNSLSGPLTLNARRFNPLEPAPPIDMRRFADATIGGAGILNGQIISQPLVNPDQSGYTQSMWPINARPFPQAGTIMPAGKA